MLDLNDALPPATEAPRYDLDLIVERLRETAQHWVPDLFPRGRRSGDEWRLANIRGDAPRNTGSCVITLRGPHAGDWIDFDGNEGGGPISAIEAATEQRAQMQKVADGMSLPVADLDSDGRVSEAEFQTGADTWFTSLDRNGDGGITLEDFAR